MLFYLAQAVEGWAGPGFLDLPDGDTFDCLLSVGGADPGTITVSGNFRKIDGTALAASTALLLYLYDENAESDFVRGQGDIDPNSGEVTATFTDLSVGHFKAVLSFIVLDPADAGVDSGHYDTAFVVDVVNEGCSDALRIKLEWDSHDDLDLWVTDPNGDRVSYSVHATVGGQKACIHLSGDC